MSFFSQITLKQFIALVTLSVFTAGSVQAPPVFAAVSQTPPVPVYQPLEVESLSVSKTLGSVESFWKGKSPQAVIILQDAHANPEAQKKIQKLIRTFQKQYGVRSVGLEGSTGAVDTQLFKSYPDQRHLKQALKETFQKGELTAGAAAALFPDQSAPETDFYGLEDWKLYEEGLEVYLRAISVQPEILKTLELWKAELTSRKQKIYSPELLKIDSVLEAFARHSADLMKVLEALASVRKPDAGSVLHLLLAENQLAAGDETALQGEVRKLSGKFLARLETRPENPRIQSQVKDFRNQYQKFLTAELSPQALALLLEKELKTFQEPVRKEFAYSEALKRRVDDQKRMEALEGPAFLKEFQEYAQAVKESLLKNEEARALDRESRFLLLMEKLTRMELSRSEWEELKLQPGPGEAGFEKAVKAGLSDALAFYQNAEKRDDAFLRNLKDKEENSLLIAGGFHAEGLAAQLKERGISYAVILPAMNSVPDSSPYRDQMAGSVSWRDYFEIENGKISSYDAFSRFLRDRLLQSAIADKVLLKRWRDQLIRDLAEKDAIAESGRYTRFLDEAAGGNEESSYAQAARKMNRFLDGLLKLENENRISKQAIYDLLSLSKMPAAGPATAVSPQSPVKASLLGFGDLEDKSRAEKRDGDSSGVMGKIHFGTFKIPEILYQPAKLLEGRYVEIPQADGRKQRIFDSAGFKAGYEKELEIETSMGRKIFIADYHHKALHSWLKAVLAGKIFYNSKLYHIDGHPDAALAQRAFKKLPAPTASEEEIQKYIENFVGIEDFIAVAIAMGLVDPKNWYFQADLENAAFQELPFLSGSAQIPVLFRFHGQKVSPESVLGQSLVDIMDIDIDVFQAAYLRLKRYYQELGKTEEEAETLAQNDILETAVPAVARMAARGKVLTIVTSPDFIDQFFALRLTAKLLEELNGLEIEGTDEPFFKEEEKQGPLLHPHTAEENFLVNQETKALEKVPVRFQTLTPAAYEEAEALTHRLFPEGKNRIPQNEFSPLMEVLREKFPRLAVYEMLIYEAREGNAEAGEMLLRLFAGRENLPDHDRWIIAQYHAGRAEARDENQKESVKISTIRVKPQRTSNRRDWRMESLPAMLVRAIDQSKGKILETAANVRRIELELDPNYTLPIAPVTVFEYPEGYRLQKGDSLYDLPKGSTAIVYYVDIPKPVVPKAAKEKPPAPEAKKSVKTKPDVSPLVKARRRMLNQILNESAVPINFGQLLKKAREISETKLRAPTLRKDLDEDEGEGGLRGPLKKHPKFRSEERGDEAPLSFQGTEMGARTEVPFENFVFENHVTQNSFFTKMTVGRESLYITSLDWKGRETEAGIPMEAQLQNRVIYQEKFGPFEYGAHTELALLLMLKHAEEIRGHETVDLGHGISGILTIAALKLGAVRVYAVDGNDSVTDGFKKALEANQVPRDRVISMPVLFPAAVSSILSQMSSKEKKPVIITNVPITSLWEIFKNVVPLLRSRKDINPLYLVAGGQIKNVGNYDEGDRSDFSSYYNRVLSPHDKNFDGMTGAILKYSEEGQPKSFGFSARGEARKKQKKEEDVLDEDLNFFYEQWGVRVSNEIEPLRVDAEQRVRLTGKLPPFYEGDWEKAEQKLGVIGNIFKGEPQALLDYFEKFPFLLTYSEKNLSAKDEILSRLKIPLGQRVQSLDSIIRLNNDLLNIIITAAETQKRKILPSDLRRLSETFEREWRRRQPRTDSRPLSVKDSIENIRVQFKDSDLRDKQNVEEAFQRIFLPVTAILFRSESRGRRSQIEETMVRVFQEFDGRGFTPQEATDQLKRKYARNHLSAAELWGWLRKGRESGQFTYWLTEKGREAAQEALKKSPAARPKKKPRAKSPEPIVEEPLEPKILLEYEILDWELGMDDGFRDEARSEIMGSNSLISKNRSIRPEAREFEWRKESAEFKQWRETPGNEDRDLLQEILRAESQEALLELVREFPERIAIAYYERENLSEGRTVYLKLQQPLGDITVMRVKAARPRTLDDGVTVPAYAGEKGQSLGIMEVREDGEIGFYNSGAGPFGGMSYKDALREYRFMEFAHKKNKGFNTDKAMALGRFKNLRFPRNDKSEAFQSLGFVIAGMTHEDYRLSMYQQENSDEAAMRMVRFSSGTGHIFGRENSLRIVEKIGYALRKLHDAGYVHRYPHLNNIGVRINNSNWEMHLILRDLNNVFRFKETSDANKTSWRFTDFMRTWQYIAKYNVRMKLPEGMMGGLVRGYFRFELSRGESNSEIQTLVEAASAPDFYRFILAQRERNGVFRPEEIPQYQHLWQALNKIVTRPREPASVSAGEEVIGRPEIRKNFLWSRSADVILKTIAAVFVFMGIYKTAEWIGIPAWVFFSSPWLISIPLVIGIMILNDFTSSKKEISDTGIDLGAPSPLYTDKKVISFLKLSRQMLELAIAEGKFEEENDGVNFIRDEAAIFFRRLIEINHSADGLYLSQKTMIQKISDLPFGQLSNEGFRIMISSGSDEFSGTFESLEDLWEEIRSRAGTSRTQRGARAEFRNTHASFLKSPAEARFYLNHLMSRLLDYFLEGTPGSNKVAVLAGKSEEIVRVLGAREFAAGGRAFIGAEMALRRRKRLKAQAPENFKLRVDQSLGDAFSTQIIRNFMKGQKTQESFAVAFHRPGREKMLEEVLRSGAVRRLIAVAFMSKEMSARIHVPGLNIQSVQMEKLGMRPNRAAHNRLVAILSERRMRERPYAYTVGQRGESYEGEPFFEIAADLVDVLAAAAVASAEGVDRREDLKNPVIQKRVKAELLGRLFGEGFLKDKIPDSIFSFDDGGNLQSDRGALMLLVTVAFASRKMEISA